MTKTISTSDQAPVMNMKVLKQTSDEMVLYDNGNNGFLAGTAIAIISILAGIICLIVSFVINDDRIFPPSFAIFISSMILIWALGFLIGAYETKIAMTKTTGQILLKRKRWFGTKIMAKYNIA